MRTLRAKSSYSARSGEGLKKSHTQPLRRNGKSGYRLELAGLESIQLCLRPVAVCFSHRFALPFAEARFSIPEKLFGALTLNLLGRNRLLYQRDNGAFAVNFSKARTYRQSSTLTASAIAKHTGFASCQQRNVAIQHSELAQQTRHSDLVYFLRERLPFRRDDR